MLLWGCGRNHSQKLELAGITTPQGEIVFMFYDETPRHKTSIIKLVEGHYFDSLTFNPKNSQEFFAHRADELQNTVIQYVKYKIYRKATINNVIMTRIWA